MGSYKNSDIISCYLNDFKFPIMFYCDIIIFKVKLKHRTYEDESDSDTLFSFHALIEVIILIMSVMFHTAL